VSPAANERSRCERIACGAVPRAVRERDQDELIDRLALVGDELKLVAGKRGATKLYLR
jgi:hypothetical protein